MALRGDGASGCRWCGRHTVGRGRHRRHRRGLQGSGYRGDCHHLPAQLPQSCARTGLRRPAGGEVARRLHHPVLRLHAGMAGVRANEHGRAERLCTAHHRPLLRPPGVPSARPGRDGPIAGHAVKRWHHQLCPRPHPSADSGRIRTGSRCERGGGGGARGGPARCHRLRCRRHHGEMLPDPRRHGHGEHRLLDREDPAPPRLSGEGPRGRHCRGRCRWRLHRAHCR